MGIKQYDYVVNGEKRSAPIEALKWMAKNGKISPDTIIIVQDKQYPASKIKDFEWPSQPPQNKKESKIDPTLESNSINNQNSDTFSYLLWAEKIVDTSTNKKNYIVLRRRLFRISILFFIIALVLLIGGIDESGCCAGSSGLAMAVDSSFLYNASLVSFFCGLFILLTISIVNIFITESFHRSELLENFIDQHNKNK